MLPLLEGRGVKEVEPMTLYMDFFVWMAFLSDLNLTSCAMTVTK